MEGVVSRASTEEAPVSDTAAPSPWQDPTADVTGPAVSDTPLGDAPLGESDLGEEFAPTTRVLPSLSSPDTPSGPTAPSAPTS